MAHASTYVGTCKYLRWQMHVLASGEMFYPDSLVSVAAMLPNRLSTQVGLTINSGVGKAKALPTPLFSKKTCLT